MKIVVTGSSTGIGRSLVERLLSQGHSIWGLARSSQEDLAKTTSMFRFTRCDVGEWPQVHAAAKEILREWVSIDAIVTCAGLQGAVGKTIEVDPLQWSSTVRVNLDGTFYTLRALYHGFAGSKLRPKIICFSGGGATKARPRFSAYGVAKTGVVRLVETFAEEMRDSAVDINAVAPGAINTRLTEEVLSLGPDVAGKAEYEAALTQKKNGGGSMEKVYGLIDFLLSPASDGISGRLLSAPWDPWSNLAEHASDLRTTDIYTLRRILPEDRGRKFSP